MKTKILRLLKESDDYISGQQLCNQFEVSRTAVWKAIEQLKKEGYEIKAVRNRGYQLVESPDVMTKGELMLRMSSQWAGKEIAYYDETGSTNTQAKADADKLLAKGENPHGKLFVAEKQNAGRGRRGRAWVSPTGTSIAMSLVLRPEIYPDRAPMLTLVMALSVAEAIEVVTGLKTQIKWPNDILVNGKKICGILTEMSLEMSQINYVVIGIGINVNQDAFPEEIQPIATSLYLESGKTYKREDIIAETMVAFEKYYDIFLETMDFSNMQKIYNEHLVNKGKEVRVLEPKGEFNGIAQGIDEQGQLLVKRADGEIQTVFAGEVSVRGIYGYV